ncbi:MAG: carotenoid 1,2-hydratase [Methylocystis sp.]|nr:carotenoid 1,2-hydratase [Methylocystis sp.]MCA3584427.1 carotenoid 1,2-hydratase [Methylocystis sp.]MCA3587210.1 carotenoid 1,2-hydratase [Methylocystis sp.]MCA3592552.1 carotenoid 1,2-hydratase [Methylocystis sp.]
MSFALPDGPDFSEAIPSGGYLWWYLDGISNDGRHGITLIAFVGSVFSPYYRRALARGVADPEDHVAINVALYGPGGRWCMTERGKRQLSRSARRFRVGPSRLAWTEDGRLEASIDERAAPLPFALRGAVRLTPTALTGASFALDEAGLHHWRPIAPTCRIEVAFDDPKLAWSGSGYLDSNRGARLPEHDFERWDWSRAPARDRTTILYDMDRRAGGRKVLALAIGADGSVVEFSPPPRRPLPPGRLWRAGRSVQADADFQPLVIETFEDTPFYARSLVQTRVRGETLTCFHESLMLDRLTNPIVQRMLPFRMPRWTR